jgi:hypothetical protein
MTSKLATTSATATASPETTDKKKNQLAYMMIPKQITAPREHGVHKKSGKNKRENQGSVYRKNPRMHYSRQIVTHADYYIECFRKTERHSKQITILNALGKQSVTRSRLLY